MALAAQEHFWRSSVKFRQILDATFSPPWDEVLTGKVSNKGSLALPFYAARSRGFRSVCSGETRQVVLDPDRVARTTDWDEAPCSSKVWVWSKDENGEVVLKWPKGIGLPSSRDQMR